ncbi:TPA: hypothetical protein ACX3MJ_000684 [Raoultella ornithinolytica]
MSKSTITREESVQAVFDLKAGYTLGLADVEILKRVARMALAAMDSEPVAWMVIDIDTGERIIRCDRSYIEGSCQPLYRHAQPAPELTAIVDRLNGSGYEYEGWEVTPQNAAAVVNILLQQLDDAVQSANGKPVKRVNADQMQRVCLEANRHLDKYGAMAREVNKLLGRIPAQQPAPVVVPEGLNPETTDLVLRFASALADKLYKAEQKYGRSTDWMKDDWYDDCLQSLWEHIEKGDPRDVAAYCAFMWYHGWKTEAAQPAPVVPEIDRKAIADKVYGKCSRIPGATFYNAAEFAIDEMEACRAAMLQAVPLTNEGDIALHNYRTALEGIGHIRRTLEETFGGLHGTHVEPDVLIECKTICDAIYAAYSGNSPVIPNGLIAEVNRLLDSDGSPGCYSAIRCGDAHDEIERLLATAPQEVQGE